MARFFLLHHTACLPERLILQTGHASSEEHCQWPNCDSRKHLCPTVPGERPVNLYYIDPSRIRRVCSVQLLSHVQLFATHELQHARLPCPSPTPWVQTNPCPLSGWCHPTITSSVVPFPSCPQSFPASGSFQMSQLFASGGQNIGVSASTSVLPMNTQDWSPLGCDRLDLLAVQGTLKSLLQHHSSKASILQLSAFFMV